MNISFSDPLSRAWKRMKSTLFQPFDISKWFTLGFAAFLATLMSGIGGSGGGYNLDKSYKEADWQDFLEWPAIAWQWLIGHPVWFTLIILGVFFLIAVMIILTWISSRGKFMFLYNVVNDKAEVVYPWNEYNREGNSLFIWRLIFGLISFFLVMVLMIIAFAVMLDVFTGDYNLVSKILSIALVIIGFFVLIILISFISMLLNDFVVPIMYKYRINTNQAWLKFLPVLFANFWDFIVYALFVFVLLILAAISIVFFGLFTCCIGFLLLIIPYIGSVILLPVTYTFRAFSIEFIEQYGEDFTIFPKTEPVTENRLV
jgi:MFS family permease